MLNEKPYFNEAGYDKQIGRAEGEKNSVSYNENAFLVSCKSMMYLLRKPPKVNLVLISYLYYLIRDLIGYSMILISCLWMSLGLQFWCCFSYCLKVLESKIELFLWAVQDPDPTSPGTNNTFTHKLSYFLFKISMNCDGHKMASYFADLQSTFGWFTLVQHFEALVEEHFSRRSKYILQACNAYMEGIPVGCAFGHTKDEQETQKGSSTGFKIMLAKLLPKLVEAFSDNGINCSIC